MSLKADPGLWERGVEPLRRPALAGERRADVAVVGAGITGLTAALRLAEAGARVAVVEAEQVGAGASGRTSAHVTEVPDLGYVKLHSRFGEDHARHIAAAYREGADWIRTRAAGYDCSYETLPAFRWVDSEDDLAKLHEEREIARRLGVAATTVNEVPLPFPVAGANRFEEQARFHPVAYLAGMARELIAAGGELYERSRVTGWEVKDGRVEIEVGDQRQGLLVADRLVLATHTPIGIHAVQTELGPYRSYLIALRVAGAVPRGLFWDTADPYHYLRGIPATAGELLLVGGEDHKSGQCADTSEPYRRLEEWVGERFAVREVVSRWSAQLYEPADGMPYVGATGEAGRILIATGFAGVGLVGGTMAGLLLGELALGRTHPWADLFDLGRVRPLAAGSRFLAENLNAAKRFVGDRLAGPDVGSVDRIAPGTGALAEIDGDTLAVYRDERGELHALSSACTHLGCRVGWNSTERSWDCPCHGTRYKPTGEVLSGPALSPLEAKGQAVPARRA